MDIRPLQLDDPLEKYSKVLAIKGAQRQFTMEDDISAAAQQSNGDLGQMANFLMERGQFAPAMQLRTQQQQQQQLTQQQQRLNLQDRREEDKSEREKTEQALKVAEAGANDALMLDQLWTQTLQKHGGDPIMAMTEIQPIYAQVRQKWLQIGNGKTNLPEAFDPDANRAAMGQAKGFMEWVKSQNPEYGAAVNAINPDTGRPDLFQPGKNGAGRYLGVQPTAGPAQPTELTRLLRERDDLPADDSRRPEYDRAIASYKAGHGSDTNVTVNSGPMTPGKTAANQVDVNMLDTTKGLMQLEQINSQFKPEYQTLLTRGGAWWNAAKEKLGGNLTNKERQDLTEFSQYKRNSIDALNAYIKSVTGAAMTNAEAERILKGLPNPGSGLFDGDSPTEFKAKMDDALKQTKLSVARLAYIKRNGMSLEDGNGNPVVPLSRMPQLMNERGAQIEAELSGVPGMKRESIEKAVRRQLAVEFGLSND